MIERDKIKLERFLNTIDRETRREGERENEKIEREGGEAQWREIPS